MQHERATRPLSAKCCKCDDRMVSYTLFHTHRQRGDIRWPCFVKRGINQHLVQRQINQTLIDHRFGKHMPNQLEMLENGTIIRQGLSTSVRMQTCTCALACADSSSATRCS